MLQPGEVVNARKFSQSDRRLVVYVGNLDGYQGWEDVVAAMVHLRRSAPDAHLVVATASETSTLEREARRAGTADQLTTLPLPRSEQERRRLYAAADAAVVPRRAPGGLPIKLLDALARGVITVASRRATAGLPLEGGALIASDDDPEALAAALTLALGASRAAAEVGSSGRAYVRREHSASRYGNALDAVIASRALDAA